MIIDQCIGIARWGAHALPARWKFEAKAAMAVPSFERTLRMMRAEGFAPRSAIDVGAYHGEWTNAFKRVFPAARVLMVEPQQSEASVLRAVADGYGDVDVRMVLVGPEERQAVPFMLGGTSSTVLGAGENGQAVTPLAMTTLDKVVTDVEMEQVDILKLDVQGYELEVLRGGVGCLSVAEVVMLEVSLIGIIPDAPLFSEVVRFMDEKGFQVFDVTSYIWHPRRRITFQMDVLFVRKGSSLAS